MLRLFDLSLFINGFPIQEAKAELHKIIQFSEEDHAQFIKYKKEEIVAFHLHNNPFYAELVGSINANNWDDLPILNKQNLQIPLSARLSKGYNTKNIYCNKTSGSSGTPFVFAKDKYCHALTWASNSMRFGWYGIDFNTSYQARFYGIPMDFIGNKKERFKDFLSNRLRFPVFNLSDAVLEKFLQKFRTKKFDYLNGYTTSIVVFAKFLEKRDIVLKVICPSLKACFVTSEMLFESDKKCLEKQLGIPIINEYGASELDLIAFENPKGEWQINSETLFVEILNEDNQPVPNGTEGRIVITSLFNKAHPFIRYDVGDIGVLDKKSTLQKPILKKLIGRTNDVAILPSGKKSPGLTFYYITKSIIEDDGNVKEFVIKQTLLDTFEIEYVSEKELDSKQIQNIEKAISLYLEPNLNFLFIRKNNLERTNRGKLKQFKSFYIISKILYLFFN
ncbi:phenylacetate--CoA ligase family protein [Flavobacterium branchiarum]|uniref:Phenylacetate--CoA ligase family protein n=1 Tax=Flavobacterium branchiarum TaxID=1114870 RepID=A0ABV5FJK4_9FLAO|nr:phenylacetate--CoA ligase family protein [Flavobacterium branchiarum]MDN3675388.1 phenylacetate--CoA ligase family protein [Flavobacterium branchiarum]